MRRKWPDLRRQTTWTLLAAGALAFALLALSFVVEIRIVVLSPNLGDVTNALQTTWRIVLGLATIGSFLLALRETSSQDASDGPGRTFEIKGKNHDIDVHLHGFDRADDPEDDEEKHSVRVDEKREADDGAVTETPGSRTTSERVASGSNPADAESTDSIDDEGSVDGDA